MAEETKSGVRPAEDEVSAERKTTGVSPEFKRMIEVSNKHGIDLSGPVQTVVDQSSFVFDPKTCPLHTGVFPEWAKPVMLYTTWRHRGYPDVATNDPMTMVWDGVAVPNMDAPEETARFVDDCKRIAQGLDRCDYRFLVSRVRTWEPLLAPIRPCYTIGPDGGFTIDEAEVARQKAKILKVRDAYVQKRLQKYERYQQRLQHVDASTVEGAWIMHKRDIANTVAQSIAVASRTQYYSGKRPMPHSLNLLLDREMSSRQEVLDWLRMHVNETPMQPSLPRVEQEQTLAETKSEGVDSPSGGGETAGTYKPQLVEEPLFKESEVPANTLHPNTQGWGVLAIVIPDYSEECEPYVMFADMCKESDKAFAHKRLRNLTGGMYPICWFKLQTPYNLRKEGVLASRPAIPEEMQKSILQATESVVSKYSDDVSSQVSARLRNQAPTSRTASESEVGPPSVPKAAAASSSKSKSAVTAGAARALFSKRSA